MSCTVSTVKLTFAAKSEQENNKKQKTKTKQKTRNKNKTKQKTKTGKRSMQKIEYNLLYNLNNLHTVLSSDDHLMT